MTRIIGSQEPGIMSGSQRIAITVLLNAWI